MIIYTLATEALNKSNNLLQSRNNFFMTRTSNISHERSVTYHLTWGPLAQSVELRTWDRMVLGSSFVRGGGGLCPWARHFIHIAQQLKSDMLRLCGAEVRSSVTHIQIKMYAPERVNAKK